MLRKKIRFLRELVEKQFSGFEFIKVMMFLKVLSLFLVLCVFVVEGDENRHRRELFRLKHGLGEPHHEGPLHNVSELWFRQRLDHFKPTDLRTWRQRYFINDTFYKPGGPAFLMIGGEGEASPKWMVNGTWIEYAKHFNAICFQVNYCEFLLASSVQVNVSE